MDLLHNILTLHKDSYVTHITSVSEPFLSKGHESICRRELGYVAKGDLSDHPTIPLYATLRTTATGLVISRNLCTSLGLEGYHQHLNDAIKRCAKASGLKFTDTATNEFDWRWSVRAVHKASRRVSFPHGCGTSTLHSSSTCTIPPSPCWA